VTPETVRVVFLGGLGEIGRNCAAIEIDGRILVVDCGIMFPDADMPGVDLVLPDLTYLCANASRIEAIVITHGHEDHAGGLAFLLRELEERPPVPILASELSLRLARRRIEEAGVLDRAELIAVADGERRQVGPFDLQFVPVTHSVPHGFATVVYTPAGTIVHSGDFKLDLNPVDGRRTDLALLGEIARRDGVRLLLSDSTNAERPGHTPSESTVGPAIQALIRANPDKRLIVASFASHLHRIQQVVTAAVAEGRKIAFLGRSLEANVAIGRELGLLDVPDPAVIAVAEAESAPPGDSLILCTGSQGEPMSALALIAAHEHKHVKISSDDLVVLSAHAIPGNEANVGRVINALHRAGATVVDDRYASVHVSGHASAEELKHLLTLLDPEWFVPVHGEYRQMVNHARLARQVGVAEDRVIVCEDGDAVTLGAGGLEVERRAVPAGYLYVDGTVGDVGHGVLRDRRVLAEEGVVVVIVTVDAHTGEIVTGPEIVTRGWVHAPEAEELLEDARRTVRESVAEAAAEGATDFETVRRHARRSLGRFINERTRRRPVIIPVVMEV
jgi:ribonuclease J